MLASGFRTAKCHGGDLISSVRSAATHCHCRYLSISSSNQAQLPYFHKRLKKKNAITGEALESLTPTSTASPLSRSTATPPRSSSSSPTLASEDQQPTLSKRQAFKSITPSAQLMHEIRVQGLGLNAEKWSFDKATRGNKTIRPWDKKLSPEEWEELQKEKRLPPKQVWFEQRTTKVIEKEQVKFPGIRFVAGAASMKSVPSEEILLNMVRPELLEDLQEIEGLIKQAQPGTENAGASLTLSDEDLKQLREKKRAKEWEIKDSVLQEVAIVGRSNVGKSTMLNTLAESPNTARVSSKPGLTRQLNFYRCGLNFILVDMPGYGFAFAKEGDKENWKQLIEEYIATRKALKRIYVMIDARHGLKVADKEFLAMLDSKSKKFQVVLTKCDLISPPDLARCYMLVQEELKSTYRHAIAERLLMVSSYTGAGMNNLRKDMLFACGQKILVRERERPKSTLR
ncbi:hypothetical protein BGZ54_008171 [Gamsiella multidivaricata]|nr:hypothetical protein BGZ54_008171 [Gamsiella multidivaricata]